MGEKIPCKKIIMETSYGKTIELENATVLSIETEVEHNDYESFDDGIVSVENRSFTCEFSVKTITKKRFIKLLMASGIQRNGAVELAKYIYKKYGYYSQSHLLFFI